MALLVTRVNGENDTVSELTSVLTQSFLLQSVNRQIGFAALWGERGVG